MIKPSLAICIPHRGRSSFGPPDIFFLGEEVTYGFTDSLASMMHWLGLSGYNRLAILSGTSSVGAFNARNGIMNSLLTAEKQVGWRFDYTLWLDTDMRFPPGTAEALMDHKKDIVGATYVRRSPPFDMLGRPKEGSSGLARVGELVEAASLPTGVLMVKREVYDKMNFPIWKIEVGDGWNGKGEDILFCEEARRLGYEIWLDTELTKRVKHIGEKEFEPVFEDAPPSLILPTRKNGKGLILNG